MERDVLQGKNRMQRFSVFEEGIDDNHHSKHLEVKSVGKIKKYCSISEVGISC